MVVENVDWYLEDGAEVSDSLLVCLLVHGSLIWSRPDKNESRRMSFNYDMRSFVGHHVEYDRFNILRPQDLWQFISLFPIGEDCSCLRNKKWKILQLHSSHLLAKEIFAMPLKHTFLYFRYPLFCSSYWKMTGLIC